LVLVKYSELHARVSFVADWPRNVISVWMLVEPASCYPNRKGRTWQACAQVVPADREEVCFATAAAPER
jgi:hypothetical protein